VIDLRVLQSLLSGNWIRFGKWFGFGGGPGCYLRHECAFAQVAQS
jgi:hypothetical protein